MPHMIITRGLPASGKSTFAREWVNESPDNRVEVNRDNIRAAINYPAHGNKEQEDVVTTVATAHMNAAAAQGFNIIVSDTNLRERYIKNHIKWAVRNDYTVEVKDFIVEVDELITRNNARGNTVDNDVIYNLASRFPYNNWRSQESLMEAVGVGLRDTLPPYRNDETNPDAIIVDIDGTLAHHEGVRSPFDFDKVGLDNPDTAVMRAVQSAYDTGYTVIVVSGRSESCREDTEAWLERYKVPYHGKLFMRPRGDTRADWIIKDEIIRTHIQDNYHVVYCLDDRNQVVSHNRAMGYKVFQVQPGDF